QVLITKLVIVRPKLAPKLSAFRHNPLPEQCSHRKMFALVPGQRMRPSLLDVGQRDVTAVANDVHDQSVRNLMFDLRDVQKMIWCAVSPALDSLMTGGLLH